jgi:hypothetical protein
MDAPNFKRTERILQAGRADSLEHARFWEQFDVVVAAEGHFELQRWIDGDMRNITRAENQRASRLDSPQPNFQHLQYRSPGRSSGRGGPIYTSHWQDASGRSNMISGVLLSPPGREDRIATLHGEAGTGLGTRDILAPSPNMVIALEDFFRDWESLERAITRLTESMPRNAVPPASESAIEHLKKQKLDGQLMNDSTEVKCTICIEEAHPGGQVTVLPCKHWFHGGCIVPWLREHNSCPICRAQIDDQGSNSTWGDWE